MIFLHAFGGVFSLIIVVMIGFVLASKGWFSESTCKIIPKLVTNICLPPFLGATIINHFPHESLSEILKGTALPALTLVTMFGAAWLVAKVLKIKKNHLGLFCASVSNPNTIFIGIPINLALFGPASTPYVLLYYFASTTFFWTIGNYAISCDQRTVPGAAKPEVRKIQWERIVSPPIIGFLLGLGCVLAEIILPEFLMSAAMMIGEMTTPLALIFIGITLQRIGFRNLNPGRDGIIALSGRLIVSPLLVFLCLPIFDLPQLMGRVFVIQASLPVIMQIPILSAYYGTDPKFGAMMVVLSTLLCIITVPLWMCLI